MRSKAAAVLLALVMALFALTGCTNDAGKAFTLYDGNGLKIEREGVETRIYDLEGEAEYTFTSHRVKKSAADPVDVHPGAGGRYHGDVCEGNL